MYSVMQAETEPDVSL